MNNLNIIFKTKKQLYKPTILLITTLWYLYVLGIFIENSKISSYSKYLFNAAISLVYNYAAVIKKRPLINNSKICFLRRLKLKDIYLIWRLYSYKYNYTAAWSKRKTFYQ